MVTPILLILTLISGMWCNCLALNLMGGRGRKSDVSLVRAKQSLLEKVSKCGANGNKASDSQRTEIAELVQSLEKLSKTPQTAKSKLLECSSWKLAYTDFDPPAPSSGRLGPFTGAVYQYLDPKGGQIKNLLKISLPGVAIYGGLVARASIVSKDTWKIDFDYVTNAADIFGFKLGGSRKYFDKEIRLWKMTYLDDELRILRAKKEDSDDGESFVFITVSVADIPLPVKDI